jgi:hypothetical protein
MQQLASPQEIRQKTSSLVEKHIGLDSDEQVLLLIRKHWVVFRNSALLATFVPFVLLFVVFLIHNYPLDWPADFFSHTTRALFLASAAACILGSLRFMWLLYLWKHTFYVMTSKKLAIINQYNPWTYEVQQISLNNINDVTLRQEGLESFLYGYSDVTALTIAGSVFTFAQVGHAGDVQKAIMQQLALHRHSVANAG